MTNRDYSQYSLFDFLEDDFFIRWVIQPDSESNSFWKSFLLAHPEKEEAISQASSIIHVYRNQDTFLHEEGKEELWKRIATTIHSEVPVRSIARSVPFYLKVAASIALLVASSVVVWMFSGREQIITTAYGEVRTITLPDQSKVTLNGNSSLRYKTNNWNKQSAREVWMEGEAYFDVTHINKDASHIAQSDRFIVHSDDVNVEVLGTTFNFEHRRDQTDITLISGKVKVQLEKESLKSSAGMIMVPGDHLEFVKAKLVEKKKVEKLKAITAWMNHEFIFSNPQLRDILGTLSDDYGYEIKVDDELLSLSIEGDISVSSVEELLSTAEATLGLSIEKSGQHIVIKRR